MMPRPSLPVLSASSCSIQSPSDEISDDVMSVSLSRPALASVPMMAPSRAAGLSAVGTAGAQACMARAARSSKVLKSKPCKQPAPCRRTTAPNSARRCPTVEEDAAETVARRHLFHQGVGIGDGDEVITGALAFELAQPLEEIL